MPLDLDAIKKLCDGDINVPYSFDSEHDWANKARELVPAMVAEVEHLREQVALHAAALARSEFDMGPCRICGEAVVCVPDGLPVCHECGDREEKG